MQSSPKNCCHGEEKQHDCETCRDRDASEFKENAWLQRRNVQNTGYDYNELYGSGGGSVSNMSHEITMDWIPNRGERTTSKK